MKPIVDAISSHTYLFTTEDDLQRGIAAALTNSGVEHEREVRLGPNHRIDFMCGDVGIEVKIGGGITPLLRQLTGYAQFEVVRSLVVVSSKRQHAAQLPKSINGKTIAVLVVGGIA